MPPLGPALDYDPFQSSSGSGLGPALDYDPFEPQRSVMGHAREFGVGIPSGAVQAGATALRGLAAVTDPGERYRGLLTAIGEATTEEEYGHLETLISEQRYGRGALLNALEGRRQGDPEPWQALVGELPGPVEERPMWRAGDAVSDWATEKFPVAPGYEGAVSRALGEGVGSLGAGIAASAAAGPVAATALFSAMGAGEAADRAVAADASDADVRRRGGMLGLGAGATDIVPVEILMRRIPAPGRRAILEASKRLGGERVVKALGRVGMQGAVEAIQEGGQQALQNLIAAEVHTPDTAVTEGLLPAAGIGAGVGGIAGLGREGILAIASRRSRSSRGDRARATREVPPLTEEDHASPIPDQDIREGRERMADAQATTNANEWLRIEGLPEVGQPVRVSRGPDMVEGVVTDASAEDGGWITVTGPDGVVAPGREHQRAAPGRREHRGHADAPVRRGAGAAGRGAPATGARGGGEARGCRRGARGLRAGGGSEATTGGSRSMRKSRARMRSRKRVFRLMFGCTGRMVRVLRARRVAPRRVRGALRRWGARTPCLDEAPRKAGPTRSRVGKVSGRWKVVPKHSLGVRLLSGDRRRLPAASRRRGVQARSLGARLRKGGLTRDRAVNLLWNLHLLVLGVRRRWETRTRLPGGERPPRSLMLLPWSRYARMGAHSRRARARLLRLATSVC